MKIPFKKINLGKANEAIKPLLDSGFIGLGNVVFEFEQALAEYVGAKHVIAVDSCTSAIFLSLKWESRLTPVGERNTVVIPSMTVPLVANAIHEANCDFEFSDYTDWVGSMYPILGTDIWDSAHELRRDCYRKLLNVGAKESTKMCFSFYPTKTIGSADGGAIATNDDRFAEWVRMAVCYGRNQKAKYQNSWDYDVEIWGYKRHYTNLQAAICLEQLNRLDETNNNRQRIVRKYNEAFGLTNQSDYLYRITIKDNMRDAFIKKMAEVGIECGVHFKPLHLMLPFQNLPFAPKADREKVEKAYQETVSLPLYDTMTDAEVDFVIQNVNQYI